MNAEIGFDADGKVYLAITPQSRTERTVLEFVAKRLRIEIDPFAPDAIIHENAFIREDSPR